MARIRGSVCKRARGRKRRRRSRADTAYSDDDEDEEYVVGEEDEEVEEEESDDGHLVASEDESEEEFEFGESSSCEEEEGDEIGDDEEEEEEIEVPTPKPRRKASSMPSKRRSSKSRVSDEEEEDESRPFGRRLKKSKVEEDERKPFGRRRLRKSDSSYDHEEEEKKPSGIRLMDRQMEERIRYRRRRFMNSEEKEEVADNQNEEGTKPSGRRSMKFKVSDDEADEESKPFGRRLIEWGQKEQRIRSRRRRPMVLDYDEKGDKEEVADSGENEKSKSFGRRLKERRQMLERNGSCRRNSSYFEEDEEEDEAEDDDDEDFSPDQEDVDDEEISLHPENRRKSNLIQTGKKRKLSIVSNGRTESKRPRRMRSGDEEEDFIVVDQVAANGRRKKGKEVNLKNSSSTSKVMAKSKSPVESETSDFDYVTSDDDDFVLEDQIALDKHRKKIENVRQRKTRKRSSVVSESSSDSEFVISVEELRDLGVGGGVLNRPQPKRIFAGRKVEEKGKEKESDSGKQVCGICLSEEKKNTVQGVLNCCGHYFCFACIMEWSKVESRCPLCKRRFGTITKSSGPNSGCGLRKAVIRVQKRDQVYQPSEEEIRRILDPYENVVCMECQQGGDDSLMLLCDICDSSAHTYCVGLGREVPEGNWYCECCGPVGNGLSYLTNQDTLTDQGTNSNEVLAHGSEAAEAAVPRRTNTDAQRSVSLPDLNAFPLVEEEYGAMAQTPGGGALTLSGRRAIHQRIRILLSTSTQGQMFVDTDVPCRDIESDVLISEVERNGQSSHSLEGLNSLNRISTSPQQQICRPSFQPNSYIAPFTYNDGSSFQHVEGAREQVRSMANHYLKDLCRESPLDDATFRDIVRRSTHTILAACGIEHRRRLVTSPVHPPSNCFHYLEREPAVLIQDCCSSCFHSFVHDVVEKLFSAIT